MTAAEAFVARTRAQPVTYARWLDREESRRRLAEHGLPEPRCEAWRYSNPNRWYGAFSRGARGVDPSHAGAFSPGARGVDPSQQEAERDAAAHAAEAPRAVGAEVVDFALADARDRACIERHLNTAVDRGRHPLANVNDVAMRLGLLVHVAASDDPAEVVLGELGGGIERILVVVDANASATLIERGATPAHRVVECVVGDGARLDHVRLQPPADSVEYHLVATRLGASSHYRLAQYSQGATLRRNDLHMRVAGRGAEVEIRCGYRLGPRSHLDTQIGVEHEAPDAVSRQTARGVVGDRAKAVLNGRIHVAPGAQRTDAALTTKSLLLAPTAELNAKPELTIYADDVQCAHGATVGELDADALFYLRSRGVSAATARELLIGGFLAEVVGDLVADDARQLLGIAR